jgi:hypothetical protein
VDLLTIDPLWVTLAAIAIATLLGHAAITKLADRSLFEQHLAAYGVPMAVLPIAAGAVPLVEAALAVLLLTPWRTTAAGLAAVLLCGYGLAMAWHLARGRRLDCGCGGEPMAVSWWLVLRNALLACIAMVASIGAPLRTLGLGDFAALAASLALLALLYAALHEVLRIRLRVLGLRVREISGS